VESGTVAFSGGGSGNGTFTGAGSSTVTAGTLTIGGAVQNLILSGGTVNGVNASITNLTWSGGSLQGTNTVTGVSSWTGGTLNGGSTLTIASNAILNISGSANEILQGVLTNAGTVNWGGTGNLEVYNGGGIVNLAGAVFNAQNDQSMSARPAAPVFQQRGKFRQVADDRHDHDQCRLQQHGRRGCTEWHHCLHRPLYSVRRHPNLCVSSLTDVGSVNIAGNVNLNGTLGLELLNGFVPETNAAISPLNYGSYSGGIETFNLPELAAGEGWSIVYGSSSLTLTVAGPHYSLSASNNPPGAGTVSGAGYYASGTTNTLSAFPSFGYIF